jgi:hypothetical protein
MLLHRRYHYRALLLLFPAAHGDAVGHVQSVSTPRAVCVCVYVCVCYIRMHVYLGKPEPLMCTVYDRIFGDFPAN